MVEEGISAYPQAVTGQMLRNFVGGAAISVLARQLQATLDVVDLGTIDLELALPGVRHLRLGAGTANFARQPAMTEAQWQAALAAGRDSALRAAEQGATLFIGGEMGIGNTTAAAALASVLLECSAQALSGRYRSGCCRRAAQGAGDRACPGAARLACRRPAAGPGLRRWF